MDSLLGRKVSKKQIGYLVIAIVGLWIGITFVVVNWGPDVGPSGGVKGDAFGAVNALFSGLALAGVIVAILLQSEELKLQRKELKHTRKELRGQKEQLEAQVRGSLQREFDVRYFETMRLFRQCIDGLSVNGGAKGIIHGTAALSFFCEHFDLQDKVFAARVFATNDRSFGNQIRPIMQILELAVQMLADEQARDFHFLLLKSTSGRSDQLSFFFYVLEEESRISGLAKELNAMAFFDGIKLPDVGYDFNELTPKAFGVNSFREIVGDIN